MARGRKRTRFQIEQARSRVTELYLQGWRQSDIANELDVSQQQISYDIRAIQKRWREDTTINLDEAKHRELERIDVLEREYWSEYTRSKDERLKIREWDDPRGVGRSAETEWQTGNPAYLSGIQWCIEQRCKILGLYAAEKREHSGPDGGILQIIIDK